MQSWKIEESTHRQIYVDITHDCNLNCNYCYDHPNREKEPEFSLDYFEEVCKRLTHSTPAKKWIRICGGEPTIDDRLFDFIRIAKKYGHLVSMSSNGIRLGQDIGYCKELQKNAPFFIGITLDGGIDNAAIYTKINGRDLSHIKMQALKNLDAVGFKHVHIGLMIVRNLNEKIIPHIFSIARQYKNIKGLHFRSGNDVGKHPEGIQTLTIQELKNLIFPYIKPSKNSIFNNLYLPQKSKDCCGGCYQYNGKISPGRTVKTLLIEFGAKRLADCWWRGKLTTDYKIESYFGSMR